MPEKRKRIKRSPPIKKAASSARTSHSSRRLPPKTNSRQNNYPSGSYGYNTNGRKYTNGRILSEYPPSRQSPRPYSERTRSEARQTHYSYSRKSSAQNIRSSRTKAKNLRKSSGKGAKNFAIGIFVIIFAYVSVIAYKFITKAPVPNDSVIYGSIDTVKTITGIIIRSEKVYNSPSNGTLSFNVNNLEKVKKGDVVCTVRDDEVVSSLEEELKDINKDMLAIQDSRDDLSAFSEDIKRIDSQIKAIVDENAFEASCGDIIKICYIKDNVKKKMDSKNQMLLSENSSSLQELADKKNMRENEINQNTARLTADESGIVSYSFDGLEQTLKPDSLSSLTQEQTLMDQDNDSLHEAAGYVNKSENIFKIISSNTWYIASYIDNADLDGWKEGDNRTIYIKNGSENIPSETKIYKISQSGDKTYVVFELTKDILDYIDSRSIVFEINKAREGLKINSSAIVEAHNLKIPVSFITEDGFVIKKTDDSVIKTAVSISKTDENGEYAYVPIEYNNINASDEIVNPSDENDVYKITDIETLKGVYVINTGVTEFKSINLENSVQNSTHIILDPSLNTNIKVYDKIITDVKNINGEEKIY